jgi:hypothetical protein
MGRSSFWKEGNAWSFGVIFFCLGVSGGEEAKAVLEEQHFLAGGGPILEGKTLGKFAARGE